MNTLRNGFAAAALAAGMLPLVTLADCSVSGPGISCVMTGLDNPRGMAFGLHGALFVAEAGRGGAVNGPCVGVAGLNCFGESGAVSRLWDGRQDRVATGLPSLGFPGGALVRGAHDIVMRSPQKGHPSVLGIGGALVTIGLEKDPAVRTTPARRDFAKLVHIPATTLYAEPGQPCTHDCWEAVVDIGGYQPVPNPDPNRETDPYGMIAEHQGVVLTDASRNWLLRVDEDGTVSRIASLPSRFDGRSTDSVPTTVVAGPDGMYYVGELVGVPFTGPARPPSNIYRVDPDTGEVSVFLTGFNAIIDMAFHGNDLYVLQHWTNDPTGADGRLVRRICTGRPLACDVPTEVVMDNLNRATALLIERGGIYLALRATLAPVVQDGKRVGQGEVIRIELDDDDDEPMDMMM